MKRRFCTSSEFTPISVRSFPPLAKGGLGGVVPAEPWPGTRVPSCWALRNCRLGRACSLCPVHPPEPPLRKGGKGLARIVIRSRAPKTRVSKPSREHVDLVLGSKQTMAACLREEPCRHLYQCCAKLACLDRVTHCPRIQFAASHGLSILARGLARRLGARAKPWPEPGAPEGSWPEPAEPG